MMIATIDKEIPQGQTDSNISVQSEDDETLPWIYVGNCDLINDVQDDTSMDKTSDATKKEDLPPTSITTQSIARVQPIEISKPIKSLADELARLNRFSLPCLRKQVRWISCQTCKIETNQIKRVLLLSILATIFIFGVYSCFDSQWRYEIPHENHTAREMERKLDSVLADKYLLKTDLEQLRKDLESRILINSEVIENIMLDFLNRHELKMQHMLRQLQRELMSREGQFDEIKQTLEAKGLLMSLGKLKQVAILR